MLGHLQTLLESMVTNPKQQLSDLSLLTQAERHQLVEWNNTQVDYPQDACIHQLFEAQVERTPDAVAAVFEDQQLTYRELNQRANQLAHYLRELGVEPEVLVGICVERSIEMVIGLLGILKAGGAYVPLDPEYPQERLSFMLRDTQAPLLLTQKRLIGCLPESTARIVYLDADWTLISQNQQNPVSGVTSKNLAYVMYTSGSTGQPKGVMIAHRGVCNHLLWIPTVFQPVETDRVLQKASLSFDVSVSEIFWPLLAGLQLVIAKPGGHRDIAYLARLIAEQKVTFFHTVPSLLQEFLKLEEVENCNCLRHVTCGGEALPIELRESFFKRLDADLYNAYGPTEATIGVTLAKCQRESSRRTVPIGFPIANMQVYLLDSHLKPVPIGVPGELFIGGDGLARGYLNQPKLTATRFISNPFTLEDKEEETQGEVNSSLYPSYSHLLSNSRLYKTGDLAYYLPDGSIEFLSRIDNQVKLRGVRIELGEIEAMLKQHPGVKETVVVDWKDDGNQRLVAYIVPSRQAPTAGELRDFLKQKLPSHMLVSSFMMLGALPLTPSGKVNRRALPTPDTDCFERERMYVEPRNSVELRLTKIWEDVLGIHPIGVTDNFFDLGGHSLLAVRLFAQSRKVFGKDLPLSILFQAPTIEQLAQLLQQDSSVSWSSLVAIQPKGSKPPLFFPHAAGGHVLYYRNLARHLDPEQPFYGLEAKGLDGKTPHTRVENMAADYIQEIQTVQPEGPYFLGGSSMGGLLALEMAQQLQAQNQQVAMVILIDAHAPGSRKPLPLRNRLLRNWHHLLQLELKQKPSYLLEKTKIKQKLQKIASKFSPKGEHSSSPVVEKTLVERANYRAATDYIPQAYSGRVVLLRASEQPIGWWIDPKLGWGSLLTGELEIYDTPGHHHNMFSEAHVQIMAEKIRTCLQQLSNR
jgi:amino acid adenylation domain-containing protein